MTIINMLNNIQKSHNIRTVQRHLQGTPADDFSTWLQRKQWLETVSDHKDGLSGRKTHLRLAQGTAEEEPTAQSLQPEYIVLTGSTGSLAVHILRAMLDDPKTKRSIF